MIEEAGGEVKKALDASAFDLQYVNMYTDGIPY
jgi:hypothetical protein